MCHHPPPEAPLSPASEPSAQGFPSQSSAANDGFSAAFGPDGGSLAAFNSGGFGDAFGDGAFGAGAFGPGSDGFGAATSRSESPKKEKKGKEASSTDFFQD